VLSDDENPLVRCAAAYSVGRLDQGTKAAVPGLRKAAANDDDGPLRVAAHTALWRITGEKASRQYVMDALKDESSEVRREAVSALASRVGDDKSIVAALVPMLGDNHLHVRREALLVVRNLSGAFRSEIKKAVPALVDMVADEDAEMRHSAVGTLGGLG